ncbi:MAG TPA: response regulator [Candidatus Limnocylindria bacterium]|nr:response regulator [Candidatus Limnocylindria bacterium]
MPRITVVNDNPDFLELVGEILTDERHTVTLIDGDRDDALVHVKESNPELLIIDLRMGSDELHGWHMAMQVRADDDLVSIPILVCSADQRALGEVGDKLETTHLVERLQKPFAIDELIAKIDELLAAATG